MHPHIHVTLLSLLVLLQGWPTFFHYTFSGADLSVPLWYADRFNQGLF